MPHLRYLVPVRGPGEAAPHLRREASPSKIWLVAAKRPVARQRHLRREASRIINWYHGREAACGAAAPPETRSVSYESDTSAPVGRKAEGHCISGGESNLPLFFGADLPPHPRCNGRRPLSHRSQRHRPSLRAFVCELRRLSRRLMCRRCASQLAYKGPETKAVTLPRPNQILNYPQFRPRWAGIEDSSQNRKFWAKIYDFEHFCSKS